MKYILKKYSVWFLVFLGSVQCLAQTDTRLTDDIPFDISIKTGELDNGLKYFIKKNTKPENRVELRLVVKVGSILEDDDQRGLAHFTEHMAFNGSKNFKKNELVDYLQSVGVKFGAHLNAYTSFDETVYILPIPSNDEGILEKGMTILEDWGSNLLFEEEEITKERGVVMEEWRLGQGAEMRMLEDYLPVILKDSKYAERLPIGTKETLESFKPETIKRFYNDWYRPNLMAVIAVGDIDVDQMEKMIKSHFSKFENPKNERVREISIVPDNGKPLVGITSDKEATNIVFDIMYKSEARPEKIGDDYRNGLVNSLFTSMVNRRLQNLLQNATPPYLYASTSIEPFISQEISSFSCFTIPKPDDMQRGISTMLDEIRRVELHGFTASELKVEKLNLLEAYKSAYEERDKTESSAIVQELIGHFLEKEPVPGIEYEYQFAQDYVEGIELSEVNAIVGSRIKKENRVIYLTAPDNAETKLPDTDTILEWVKQSSEKQLDALKDEEVDAQLIKAEITSGSVVKATLLDKLGAKLLKLSNGASVYLKKTDFKNDEVQFLAHRKGGISIVEDDGYWSALFASGVVSLSGIGDFSHINLQKALAGKSVGLNPYIGELEEGMRGSSSPDDIETMLQLAYLYFTEVRKDEASFQSLIERNKAFYSNALSDPNYYFQDKKARILSQNHLRGGGFPATQDLDRVDLDQCIEFFKARFSSPGDFDFWFVGNFNEAELIPMVEKYLGSISKTDMVETWKDRGIRPPSGKVDEKINKGSAPKSSVNLYFLGEFKYSREESYYLRCLSELLDIKLIETLREQIGGVYGVGSSGAGSQFPYENYEFTVSFPCGPENVDQLIGASLDVIRTVQTEGVSDENLNKIKEAQRRDMEINWKENSFWMSVLKSYHVNEYDDSYLKWLKTRAENLTSKDLQRVANKYLDTESFIKIVLYPEE